MLKNNIKSSFKLAGAGIGLGIIGEHFGSSSLSESGKITTGFVPIAVNVGMGAYTIKMLKNIRR